MRKEWLLTYFSDLYIYVFSQTAARLQASLDEELSSAHKNYSISSMDVASAEDASTTNEDNAFQI